jgi:hypothetical protein
MKKFGNAIVNYSLSNLEVIFHTFGHRFTIKNTDIKKGKD